MAHAQKPDFVFPRNGLFHLNRWGASFQSTASSRVVRISLSNAGYTTFGGGVRVLATHSIQQFPLHFPSRASPCATRFRTSSPHSIHHFPLHFFPSRASPCDIRFQLDSTSTKTQADSLLRGAQCGLKVSTPAAITSLSRVQRRFVVSRK